MSLYIFTPRCAIGKPQQSMQPLLSSVNPAVNKNPVIGFVRVVLPKQTKNTKAKNADLVVLIPR